jgi:hypothetical protein
MCTQRAAQIFNDSVSPEKKDSLHPTAMVATSQHSRQCILARKQDSASDLTENLDADAKSSKPSVQSKLSAGSQAAGIHSSSPLFRVQIKVMI